MVTLELGRGEGRVTMAGIPQTTARAGRGAAHNGRKGAATRILARREHQAEALTSSGGSVCRDEGFFPNRVLPPWGTEPKITQPAHSKGVQGTPQHKGLPGARRPCLEHI